MGDQGERRANADMGRSVVITTRDLRARVAEWALRDDVVEKDYVLGWVLAAIGTEPVLRDGWVF